MAAHSEKHFAAWRGGSLPPRCSCLKLQREIELDVGSPERELAGQRLASARAPVLSENHIRTYWWCSPARIGMATMAPDRWTARCKGASFCNAKCVRKSTRLQQEGGTRILTLPAPAPAADFGAFSFLKAMTIRYIANYPPKGTRRFTFSQCKRLVTQRESVQRRLQRSLSMWRVGRNLYHRICSSIFAEGKH